jgi:hypothetical protein
MDAILESAIQPRERKMRALEQLKVSAISIGLALGLASGAANAFIAALPTAGTVSSTVTQTGSNTWEYQFTVFNTSPADYVSTPAVVSFEIPYFTDSGIQNITSPAGWTASVWDEHSFGSGLVWGNDYSINYGIRPGQSLSGFGFTASFAPVKGPFILYFTGGDRVMDDPAIPGSPLANSAGYTEAFPVTSVPEPETYAMMLAGLGLLGFAARRRKMAQR